MKTNLIVADCPWSFSDKLEMSDVKRGAEANYSTLSIEDLKNLDVKSITEDDALLVLWCPSSLLKEGLEVMQSWGFRQTQTHVWVKIKISPFKFLLKEFIKSFKKDNLNILNIIKDGINSFNLNNILAFGMGRVFRGCHEIAILGVKGKIYKHIKNKSQRSVHFYPVTKHSEKPELLQDMLEKMFPDFKGKMVELFARREREGWVCVGNEIKGEHFPEDIRDSIERIKKL